MEASFFQNQSTIFFVEHNQPLDQSEISKLEWLFDANQILSSHLIGPFVGPRKEMVTPWSTNAVEILQISGIPQVSRVEQFVKADPQLKFDPMLQESYAELSPSSLQIDRPRQAIRKITDITAYNQEAALALSPEEIQYLEGLSKKLGRPLSDAEIFGFAQVNSEHCRHKVFNGTFVIDGKTMEKSLFKWIKETTKAFPGEILNFYNDNVAFFKGFSGTEFKPENPHTSSFFVKKKSKFALSLKAETHNFPTTVEPFNGAATGSGGEIRDRMAGGKGSFPLAGTACYMTSYPRHQGAFWETRFKPRHWLYQSPQQILTKASNGASDYGNKFGQPLINGSLMTFEGRVGKELFAYDKTVMLAGGIGYAKEKDILKAKPKKGDKIILMGGDNYRIGMGGGAVSSVETGSYKKQLELNAVQRSNPEMQKRVFNALRSIYESEKNPIVLIHDHGAGGHINCLSELVEASGGEIEIVKLPVGDPSLSDLEIVGNESQERMGLVIKESDVEYFREIAKRERAPFYVVGTVTGDGQFIFRNKEGDTPVNLSLEDMFGNPPKTVIHAETTFPQFNDVHCSATNFRRDLQNILRLEHVGCKDWLTNKVDRSVTGKVALQQCTGPYQLPLNGAGVMAVDLDSTKGIATAMGHQPIAGLLDPISGSILGITEALTNLIFVPLEKGLSGVTLSANWMWPCRTEGEDSRIYRAVEAASQFAQQLGINISTGKDSLSMTQKYPNGEIVRSPGTVIFSAVSAVSNTRKCITPDLKPVEDTILLYLNFSFTSDNFLGGSALFQTLGELGNQPPNCLEPKKFIDGFGLVQSLLKKGKILAGQDVSSGGLITAILEMAFAGGSGLLLTPQEENSHFQNEDEFVQFLFCEKPGLVLQVREKDLFAIRTQFTEIGIESLVMGICKPQDPHIEISYLSFEYTDNVSSLRRTWYSPSFYMDEHQSFHGTALKRFQNFDKFPLKFSFPEGYTGKWNSKENSLSSSAPIAAIIREKGTNGEREMAYSLYEAGFRVKDVSMTDLISGREDLSEVSFAVFCGGFSNSDVLGSAKGWAAAFKFNSKAKASLEAFYQRPDTLSLGVCNGCQLMVLLDLINPSHFEKSKMLHNVSGKFESSFLSVTIPDTTPAVMLQPLKNTTLGIWIAHGEGKFMLPQAEQDYSVALRYISHEYPMNPNGSDFNVAGISSADGRHLAMMPHLERAIFPWQWGYYPHGLKEKHQVTPWLLAFKAAHDWCKNHLKV